MSRTRILVLSGAVILTAALVVLPGRGTQSEAQIDLAKALVGRWQGRISGLEMGGRGASRSWDRTLVIESVEEKDGQGACRGSYGEPGGRLRQVECTVSAVEGAVVVEFLTPGGGGDSGPPLRLKLEGQNVLRGAYRPRGWSKDGDLRLVRTAGTQ